MAYPRTADMSKRMIQQLQSYRSRRGRDYKTWAKIGGAALLFGVTVNYLRPSTSNKILALDLSSPPPSIVPLEGILEAIIAPGRPTISMLDMMRVIKYAETDDQVKGIICNLSSKGSWTLSQAQEMRQASEMGEANTNYYLASACDRIYMSPSGDVGLMGLLIQQPFVRPLLDRLGILPQFSKRKEYKNAPNMFTETHMTPAHKESVLAMASSLYSQITAGIAVGRAMTQESVLDIFARGPFNADEASGIGLVDGFMHENDILTTMKALDIHWDKANQLQGKHINTDNNNLDSNTHPPNEVEKAIVNTTTTHPDTSFHDSVHPKSLTPAMIADLADDLKKTNTKVIRFNRYAMKALAKLKSKDSAKTSWGAPRIALIYALGEVTNTDPGPFATPGSFHSPTIAKQIEVASRDPRTQVLVFRIDSPGGSYIASDTVYAALQQAKARGLKVVVSMGTLAASGGYFAAAPADYIFALPATLTGSIGVFGGKFALKKFLSEKIGIEFDEVKLGGDNAGMFSMISPWTPSQFQKLENMMDRIYADFVAKVATGRKMTLMQAEEVAKGRVWTGEDALKLGLVDEMGGLVDAIDKARSLLPSSIRDNAVVETYPKIKNPLLRILFSGDPEQDDAPLFSSSAATTKMKGMRLSDLSPTLAKAAAVGNLVQEVDDLMGGGLGSGWWRNELMGIQKLGINLNLRDSEMGVGGLLNWKGEARF